ncbi:cold-responsive protein kinase 1-like [Neltuma alba]|uniref:cold-responsive protein kinase 1-like n=1 Tax=Neltuma alba TaxID=207710 RepID=UPI0010A4BDF8|nr:cold-responsive protein kinase 1-like [Prosopis alba]
MMTCNLELPILDWQGFYQRANLISTQILQEHFLEIISGRKSEELRVDGDAEGEFLLQKAWKLYERGMHLESVDSALDSNEYDAEEVKKIIEIGLLCTQASPTIRPTMSEVVVLLQNKGLLENIRPTMPILIETN